MCFTNTDSFDTPTIPSGKTYYYPHFTQEATATRRGKSFPGVARLVWEGDASPPIMSLSTFLENVCQSELCGHFPCDHIWDDGGSGQKRKWIEFLGKGSLCGLCTIFWQAEGEGKSWHPWRVLTAFFISTRRGRSRAARDSEAVISHQLPDDRGEGKGASYVRHINRGM